MAEQKSREQLRDEAYLKADLKKDSSAIPASLANVFIQEAWTELYDLIVAMDDARIFAKNAPVGTQVGTHSYRLPNDFYHLISAHVRRGSYYIPATAADPAQFAELADNTYQYTRPEYFLREDPTTGEEWFFLFPAANEDDIAITYFPEPFTLTTDTDQLSNKGGRLEHVTLGAAVRMLRKVEREEQAQSLMAQQKVVEERLMGAVTNRDMNNPRRIRDISYRFEDGWGSSWG